MWELWGGLLLSLWFCFGAGLRVTLSLQLLLLPLFFFECFVNRNE